MLLRFSYENGTRETSTYIPRGNCIDQIHFVFLISFAFFNYFAVKINTDIPAETVRRNSSTQRMWMYVKKQQQICVGWVWKWVFHFDGKNEENLKFSEFFSNDNIHNSVENSRIFGNVKHTFAVMIGILRSAIHHLVSCLLNILLSQTFWSPTRDAQE